MNPEVIIVLQDDDVATTGTSLCVYDKIARQDDDGATNWIKT